ncbi:tyrosinase family protein [Streptomyces coeruleorubidus]|uniref:tyrosinase family protein n=1 Tax=Streptomyces coeruleorubidus TaxID=116188 RepID=UPI0038039E7E
MIRGDGIRRNVAEIDDDERDAFVAAIKELNNRHYPGSRDEFPPGGVSQWFKQDEIHQATHVHQGPEFLPWHRELCNRFEQLIREANPQLSLHYWDWTTDPDPLFTPQFMGAKRKAGEGVEEGEVGEPWRSAGFYDPDADPFRGESVSDAAHAHPFDPPRSLTRKVADGPPDLPFSDREITRSSNYLSMRIRLERCHDFAHGYIGGTIGNPHTAFRDPFVYLLHSNVDRLFAMWQYEDPAARLNPTTVYGDDPGNPEWYVRRLQPWDGSGRTRPWVRPESERLIKDYRHPSIVNPAQYDTLQPVGDGLLTAQQLHELRQALGDAAALHTALSHAHHNH